MELRSGGTARAAVLAGGITISLAACGSGSGSPSPTVTAAATTSPVATAAPTPSPSPAPAPLVVTLADIGPSSNPLASIRLTVLGEDGTVLGSVDDTGGIDGDSYAVGANHVYFIDGVNVKAMGRDGTVSTVGEVPDVSATATASAGDRQEFTALAVSPDESTLLFGVPIAVPGEDASEGHSQLWTEPVGGTSSEAIPVYNETGGMLRPFAWSDDSVWVSDQNVSGLGGYGPFIDYTTFNPATFDPTSHVLTPVPSACFLSDAGAVDADNNHVCEPEPNTPTLKVSVPSGTKTVTMVPASATAFGNFRVSDDGRYLAYGVFTGDLNTGRYTTVVVDLETGTTLATLHGYVPGYWLDDDRLTISAGHLTGPTYLLSPAISNPTKISPDPPIGALP